ncbi:MAG: class I SAM-dependent methyltransferase [Anaerolineae bacterium]|nr:class I SAM-dependent methyltransferase [Anaerolineae bacterium]
MHTNKITDYYDQGREQNRLTVGGGQLELIRSQEIVLRYLPKPPAVVMDIGGGAGIYAFWLAELGYTVHLIDLIPLHIEQANATTTNHPLASGTVGDARHVNFPDASADAVLLFGPLYHLTERVDRIQTLREAWRLLKPSGLLFAATISRFASLMDGLKTGLHRRRSLCRTRRAGFGRWTASQSHRTARLFHHRLFPPSRRNSDRSDRSRIQSASRCRCRKCRQFHQQFRYFMGKPYPARTPAAIYPGGGKRTRRPRRNRAYDYRWSQTLIVPTPSIKDQQL